MKPAFETRPVEEFELDSWDEFLRDSCGGTLFHTSVWQKVINRAYEGREDEYHIVGAWLNGRLVGGFCGLARRKLGVLTLVTPLCTPYTGLVLSAELEENQDLLCEFLLHMNRYRYQHVQCAPAITALPVLNEMNYRVLPRRTLEINLRLHENELWNSFESNVRRNIRKAEKQEFEISDRWDAAPCYGLFRETFDRQGEECPVWEELFHGISSGETLAPYRSIYTARRDGRVVGFIVALNWNGTVYYALAATSHEERSTGVASLLIWTLLRDYLGADFQAFDFVGGNIPAISQFKEKFNPAVRPHVILELCLSKRIRFGRAVRELLKR